MIGSVQAGHESPLSTEELEGFRHAVGQAAPVLGNLRNLALTEARAATDALTSLPNARSVHDNMKRMVAQAARALTPLAVVVMDLDRFKQINDNYGHGRGDDLLAAVGAVLAGSLRDQDFVGRYGGEEFVILLPNTPREGAIASSEKVRNAIAAISVPGIDRAITASFGVAVFPDDGGDAKSLLRNADRALYAAKGNGRNQVQVFNARTEAARDA